MIYLAADHRGFVLKEIVKRFLAERGIVAEDCGAFSYNAADDYTDFVAVAAAEIAASPTERRGIFLCGSGHGVDITANKFRGVRAALCWNSQVAKQSREHEDANVLVLPADWLNDRRLKAIIMLWLETPFSREERHTRRLKKIADIERLALRGFIQNPETKENKTSSTIL